MSNESNPSVAVPTPTPERREFTMTADEWAEMMQACRPVPYMIFGGMAPSSPRENANRAWQALGRKHGFDWSTVQPVPGKAQQTFSAEVTS